MSDLISPTEPDAKAIVSTIQEKIKMQKDRAPDPHVLSSLKGRGIVLVSLLFLLIVLWITRLLIDLSSVKAPAFLGFFLNDRGASVMEALMWIISGTAIFTLFRWSTGARSATKKAIKYVRETHGELTYLEEYVESLNADLYLAQEAAEWTAEKHGDFTVHLKKMEQEFIPALAEARQRLEELDKEIEKEKKLRKQQMARHKKSLHEKLDTDVLPLIDEAQEKLENLRMQMEQESEFRKQEAIKLAESLKKEIDEEIDRSIELHNLNIQKALGIASDMTKVDRSDKPDERVEKNDGEEEIEKSGSGLISPN